MIWSAPAGRSADGALDRLGPSGSYYPKRCRATLATALQIMSRLGAFSRFRTFPSLSLRT